jgi:hypothetical protein
MRWLTKHGGDGTLWPWTAALAKRRDMVEVDGPVAAVAAPVVAKAATTAAPDIYGITDKDELRQIGRDVGIVFTGSPSLKNMQTRLAEHFNIPPVTE